MTVKEPSSNKKKAEMKPPMNLASVVCPPSSLLGMTTRSKAGPTVSN